MSTVKEARFRYQLMLQLFLDVVILIFIVFEVLFDLWEDLPKYVYIDLPE